ncbi:uncharacterized protein LOC126609770 [Malus sylvestris]|uniref:uncharacterized protein LOC126609770 n=1 Tax=Malus sylvestris TaxID=3752 RepID=UPI0021AC1C6F|nr:uncharacterized protein LOC126609770 [Malus sylvestris]XP_050133659.1 uncharacterized protein LOC126609770 [Malus sylvestris]
MHETKPPPPFSTSSCFGYFAGTLACVISDEEFKLESSEFPLRDSESGKGKQTNFNEFETHSPLISTSLYLRIPGLDESYLPRWIGYGFGSLLIMSHFVGSTATPAQLEMIMKDTHKIKCRGGRERVVAMAAGKD